MSSAIAPASQVWEATLAQLMLRVTRQNYDTWLRSTVGLRFEGTTLVVGTTSELACDWLSTRMRNVIGQALLAAAGAGLTVSYEALEQADATNQPRQPSMLPRPTAPLNPRFTFETFLESSHNRVALITAQEIVEGNHTHSPLFITGGSGSGKTHLLHAIAQASTAKGVSLQLVAAEQFLNEYTNAVRNKTGAAFRARYHDVDLLLVDDIHLLLGKKATLNELYQTLANLSDSGRRVVVTGDACVMVGEEVRFQSHLRWGLVASIEPASAEDRVRFVAWKASMQGAHLPEEVQHYLALRVRSSIRELEGAVNRVTALARISRAPITIDFAAKALQPVNGSPQDDAEETSPTQLMDAVCRHLDVDKDAVAGEKRSRDLTYARHIAMYLLREDGGLTYSAIARLLNKKDHSTVVHACSQLTKEITASPQVRADVDAIRAVIRRAEPAA